MAVLENIAFGLRVRKKSLRPPGAEIRALGALLQLIQLEGLAGRYPSQLSGGQRQRVALARALAVKPSVLLPDEPFGALDGQVRKELRRWLRRLHEEVQVTTVFVTHDQEEAINLFHGRLTDGPLHIGDQEMPAPEWADAPDAPAIAGVRPRRLRVFPQQGRASCSRQAASGSFPAHL